MASICIRFSWTEKERGSVHMGGPAAVGPLETKKVRLQNVVLLDLYQSRAVAGGYPRSRRYPPEKERSRGTFVNKRVW